MTPELRRVGESQSPIVILDGFSGKARDIVELAAALAPFAGSKGSYYPGLRRIITRSDVHAYAYVDDMLREAAPYIGGGFDIDEFNLLEASFSMVTAAPDSLSPVQRAPHFDSLTPSYLAVLHYLSDTQGSGTAFYRHRVTGIERVDESNVGTFVAAARREVAEGRGESGYINGSTACYEQIGSVESAPDRLVVYHGCLLHSGLIPPDMNFSSDPRRGRLTANIFIDAR